MVLSLEREFSLGGYPPLGSCRQERRLVIVGWAGGRRGGALHREMEYLPLVFFRWRWQ